MKLYFLLGFVFLTMVVHCRKMERREFAKAIHQLHLNTHHDMILTNWLCIVEVMRNLNTKATHYKPRDQSTNGIFQIDSHYWWDDGKIPNTLNECKVKCSELLEDNLRKAINCAKKILVQEGHKAWHVFNHCKE
uniref:lysozyme n=1 Tax=Vombatus ursinus TaxID=29139 RepID=A0A4X2M5K6_VOMUR